MSRTTLDLWVGVFVAVGFAALVFLAVKVGNHSGSSGPIYTVSAAFDNIGGLKVRAPVKSAGVVVGRVGSIGFDKTKFRAVVRLDLDGRYTFPVDTSASILTSGLLGEQYVGLDPGAEETELKTGDQLQITQSAVVLEKLIGQFLFNKAAEAPASAK
ncbi:MAG: outer membrane lipid asymmetry maintenance protein MlaD [Azoarcus sp.]|jgi:phospholipid/cholesterol/gamma-HCH transport system substrate-binding protein|nr:outer membrane lipid asymmetry maintenance protein MlaD [Azoarcus sp.]